MAEGAERGLELIEGLARDGSLADYHLLHAARADLLQRTGALIDAVQSYERALGLVSNESERRFLQKRLQEVRRSIPDE
jgi:RNA polymerase sigma-70 factor (ECF subfamily)